ncbi:MAG: hypothetical protein HZB52_02030 [Chloroflexi bacterium]|nr:hypothetical protein [Chloroflexota bacterium]
MKKFSSEKLWIALAFLTPPLLALVLYGRVLSFPFFLDDDLNFTWMRGRALLSYWVDSSGYKYYRPITFGMWRLAQIIFGETNTFAFHAIDLVTLILIGWLVGYLAAHLQRDGEKLNGVAATLAGAFVLTSPFLPQIISSVSQGLYLYAPCALALTFVTFARYRQTGKLKWAVLTILLGLLIPAVHESLIVVGGLLFIWLVVDQEQSKPQRHEEHKDLFSFLRGLRELRGWRIPFIVTLGNALWFLLWLQIPKLKGDGLGWVGWTSLIQSITFFLQGLTFPIQPLAQVMMQNGWGEVAASLTLGAVGLILLSGILIARGKWRILVIGLAWYALNAAPMIFGLGFHYMISNMRFLVPPMPAAALLWASAIMPPKPDGSLRPVKFVVAIIAIAFILLPSSFFIQESMTLHTMSLNSVHDLREIIKANPTQKHLIINPIDWIANNKPHYAMGHETVQILPGYLTLRGLTYINTGVWANVDGVVFDNIKPELKRHWYSLAADSQNVDWETMATRLPNYDRVWLTRYSDERVDVVEAGRVESNAPITFANHLASFDEKILLVSAKADVVKNEMRLALSWQVMKPIQGEVFRHVLDCEGNVLGLGDGPALGGVYPTWLWRGNDRITDVRFIPLEKLSSCYRIEIGLYNPANGQRTIALDANQKRFENDVVVVER